MYDSLISLTFISLLALINAQHSAEQDLLEEINQPRRSSKSSFDAQFYRGQCPDRFYQLGNECVYFGTDGKRYSWQEVQHVCVERVARFLERRATFISGEIPIKPTKVLRQLILNTPQKTKILEALYQHFNELNFAVRIPSDYNTLHRCHDDKEDYWPQYCINPKFSNATCFETNQLGSNNICLSEIDCNKPTLRFACEFTLPGKSELISSQFRHCPKSTDSRHRLSVWAWILVAVGAVLLILDHISRHSFRLSFGICSS